MNYLRYPRRFAEPPLSRETPPTTDRVPELRTDDQEPIDPFTVFVAEASLPVQPNRQNEDEKDDGLSSYDSEDGDDRLLIVRGDISDGDVALSATGNTTGISTDPSLLRSSRSVRTTLVAGAVLVIGLLVSAALFRAMVSSRSPQILDSSPAPVAAATTQTGSLSAAVPDIPREAAGRIEPPLPSPAIVGTSELAGHPQSAEAPGLSRPAEAPPDARNARQLPKPPGVDQPEDRTSSSPPSTFISPSPVRTATAPPEPESALPSVPATNQPALAVAPAPPLPVPEVSRALGTTRATVPLTPPTDSGAPARAIVTPTQAIQGVLEDYRLAFNQLDVDSAHEIWPTVDRKALSRAFDQIEQQDIELETCDISVAGARAVASCGGTARYVPKVGTRKERIERRQWRFTLRQANGSWVIDSVDARQPAAR